MYSRVFPSIDFAHPLLKIRGVPKVPYVPTFQVFPEEMFPATIRYSGSDVFVPFSSQLGLFQSCLQVQLNLHLFICFDTGKSLKGDFQNTTLGKLKVVRVVHIHIYIYALVTFEVKTAWDKMSISLSW